MFVRIIYHLIVSYACLCIELFSVTHQRCDKRQGRFVIIFREDSQIDFAKENVILNVSLRRPLPPSACTLHFKLIISLVSVN